MSAEVAALHPCTQCGKPAVVFGAECDGETADILACDECMETTERDLAQVRPVHKAMLDAGVGADIASETMTFLLGLMHP